MLQDNFINCNRYFITINFQKSMRRHRKLRKNLFDIIFEADTALGKKFDIALLIIILLSVLVVVLESVNDLSTNYARWFIFIEWVFTVIFTIEYVLRIYVTDRPLKYVFSFFGIIDLLAILPAFLAMFITGAHSLLIIRTFRLLRVFRILKASRYINASQNLARALIASRAKIGVFLFAVLTIVIFLGAIMYLVEGEKNGFTSIPKSIYYTIVTLTTVGFGDITPQTTLGQFISSIVMIMGYAIIAVPTGIISVEIAKSSQNTQVCPSCLKTGHDDDAEFCRCCGKVLNPED